VSLLDEKTSTQKYHATVPLNLPKFLTIEAKQSE
jgi:hypothetical protein